MVPYRQILVRMRSGETDRAIARSGLMDRREAEALRRMAEHAGWLDPRNPLPEDSAVAAGLEKPSRPVQDLRAQAVDFSQLGSLAVAEGRHEEAVAHYQAALTLIRRIHEPAIEAAIWHRMGAVLHQQNRRPEAQRHYLEAARIREQHADLAAAAESWNQLALLDHQAGQREAAETWYRKAIDADQKAGNRLQLGAHLGNLADLLQDQPDRVAEARQLAEAAVSFHQTLDPAAPQVWNNYGVLAGILAKEAATAADDRHRAELQQQARDYGQLQQFAPRFIHALGQLGAESSYARAVVLGRWARCLYMSGRVELAIARLQEALDVVARLAPSEDLAALGGALHSELGEVCRAAGRHDQARQALAAALKIAEALQDLRASAVGSSQLGAVALAEGRHDEALAHCEAALALARRIHEPAIEAVVLRQLATLGPLPTARGVDPDQSGATSFQITLDEESITDYGLDGDLLLDGPRERRLVGWTQQPDGLDGDLRLTLTPWVRTGMDGDGAIRFWLPPGEPVFERHPGCTVMRRLRREIVVSGHSELVWRLIRAMDGTRRVADILSELSASERTLAMGLLGALAVTGAVDTSGRPIGRFLHSATKKGVTPGGGLEGDEVLQLATDGDYRIYPGAPRITLSQSIPERLDAFHALTRSRRSRRDFNGRAVSGDDFDALLQTACGVTGAISWAGREVKLRAYPASGALYAVEIYPVILRVESLAPGIYHYRAVDNCLEVVRSDIDQAAFLNAMLPAERAMVAGAAVMICLIGRFARHERKYGEGGYRMLVAETGHISQNLILAATALGLSARPFGGVFDGLMNEDLGLDCDSEQFLLAVLVGHAGDTDGQ